jgi:hypothetical protein
MNRMGTPSMPRFAVLLMLGLGACTSSDQVAEVVPPMDGWKTVAGKAPSRAEYAAILAACQGGAVQRSRGKPLGVCLTDLGLRRVD